MRRQGATEPGILDALLVENAQRCEPPLPESEVRGIAQSIARYAPAAQAEYLTDLGNGRRFARRHAHEFRYCPQLGGWLWWDGRRWAPDETGEAQRAAKETVISILGEAAEATDDDERARLAKWAIASQSANRLQAMLQMAQSEPGLVATPEMFDRDPMLFNVANGVLNLCTGELRPHAPEAMLTRLAPVEYNPDATHPLLDKYLQDVGQGDDEFLGYLQRAIGYSLSGDVTEEAVFLLLGPGATGKTSLIEGLLAVLGDYGRKLSFETFLERHDVGGPRPDLVALRGVRLAAACEAKTTRSLAEVAIKELSGGDTVTVRALYCPEVSFRPQAKIWLASNDAPRMRDDDSGLWRRLRRLPFEHVIAAPDPNVKKALQDPETGGQALLAWAVRGCLAWQTQGLGDCEIVRRKTSELRAEMDPLAEWLGQCCRLDKRARTLASELRDAYVKWASEMGITQREMVSNKEWGKRLRAQGCRTVRERVGEKRATFWVGISLDTSGHDGHDDGQFPESPHARTVREDFSENGVCRVHRVQVDGHGGPDAKLTPAEQRYLELAELDEVLHHG